MIAIFPSARATFVRESTGRSCRNATSKDGARMKTVPAKRAGIWIRVSTEDQVRGESPETHERRARLYAEAKGWQVVETYRLDAVSGKTVKEHPEAKRMLRDIADSHITGLIF
jgi:site-specific DNA recombinase